MSRKSNVAKPRRSSSSKSSGGDHSSLLSYIVLLALAGIVAWYWWPKLTGNKPEPDERKQAQELAIRNPDAEVFDLGNPEKKK